MSKELKKFLDHAYREIDILYFERKDEDCLKKGNMIREVLDVFQDYEDLSDEEFVDISKSLMKLFSFLPLSPIESFSDRPDQWVKIEEDLYRSLRYPSLGYAVFGDEHLAMDCQRFIYLDSERHSRLYAPPEEVICFVDAIVPLLFPYIPEENRKYIYLDCIYDEKDELIACGVLGIGSEHLEEAPIKIGRYIQIKDGNTKEIGILEFMKMKGDIDYYI